METLPDSGRTEISPALARLLIAVWAGVILAVPAIRHTVAGGAEPFPAFFANLGHGHLEASMKRLERDLEDSSWILETTLSSIQNPLLLWGGTGNEKVYVGYRGWLFYRPGVDYVTGPPFLDAAHLDRRRRGGPSWEAPPSPDPRPALLDFHRQLSARGIQLVVVPVPTKVTLRPEALDPSFAQRGLEPSALQNPSFTEFVATLEQAGIAVVDPAPAMAALEAEPFLKTDSHWSPEAVDATARQLAERIRTLRPAFEKPEERFDRRRRLHENLGDLARTLQLPAWGPIYRPERVTLESVVDSEGRPWESDPTAEAVLLGDSFTNVYSQEDQELRWGRGAGLGEELSFHLRRSVYRVAVNNAGATGSREQLVRWLREGRFDLEGVRVVVWQFAVRELATGDWRTVVLGP